MMLNFFSDAHMLLKVDIFEGFVIWDETDRTIQVRVILKFLKTI